MLDQTAAPFYPPRIAPSPAPLRLPFNLVKLLGNNLEAIPEQAYHQPVVVSPGPPRMAFLCDSELVRTVLLSRHGDFPKGKLQVDVLGPIFGNAMISSEGHEWRWQRGAAAPLFRHEELVQYGPIMSAAAEETIAKWRSAPAGSVHPIHTDMMRTAFRVISRTMLAGGAEEMLDAIEQGHADYYAGVNWWVLYLLLGLPHWLPRPGGKLMRAHEQRIRAAVSALVRTRRNEAAGADDLLARLLRARDAETGRAMSDELLTDNISAFLMAGYDTTAFALTWTLYLIARSPEWEQRMRDEVERVAGDGPVTAEHVDKLVIVGQVLNESLRLFPTAPVIIRDIPEDMEVAGAPIPAGTIGIVPIYAIHRHHAYWDDPHRFDPSRFAPDRRAKSSRFQFLPFGAGPRICIGAAFAMIEATIMLATFVRAARFELADAFDPQPLARMFLLPRNGMPMRVTMRTGA